MIILFQSCFQINYIFEKEKMGKRFSVSYSIKLWEIPLQARTFNIASI